MLKGKFQKTIIFATVLLLHTPSEASAQPKAHSEREHVAFTRPSAKRASGITFDVEFGGGDFQEIAVPLKRPPAPPTAMPLPPLEDTADSGTSRGPLLGMWLGWKSGHRLGTTYVRGGGLRMTSSASSGSGSSTYERLAIIIGTEWQGSFLLPGFTFTTEAEGRRSLFRNVDAGHYADSALLRAGIKEEIEKISLSVCGAEAPMTRFGYARNALGSSELSGTSAQLYEWGGAVGFHPTADASISLGLSREILNVQIDTMKAYTDLGLTLDDSIDQSASRTYNLTTTSVVLSFARKF